MSWSSRERITLTDRCAQCASGNVQLYELMADRCQDCGWIITYAELRGWPQIDPSQAVREQALAAGAGD